MPEIHLGGLIAGIALQVVVPWGPLAPAWLGTAAGALLILAGLGLIVWAVAAVGAVDMESPGQLVVRGPYSRSRNPMYVGWTVLYVGIALVLNTAWPLVLLPVVIMLTHRSVLREERRLAERFGVEFAQYRAAVRRYL